MKGKFVIMFEEIYNILHLTLIIKGQKWSQASISHEKQAQDEARFQCRCLVSKVISRLINIIKIAPFILQAKG